MKKKTKKQVAKDKVWWRKVINKNTGRWEQMFDSIDCQFMKAKVASIIWWDMMDRKHEQDLSCLDMNMRLYSYNNPNQEKLNYHELYQHLINFGYDKKFASVRATTPKNMNGGINDRTTT